MGLQWTDVFSADAVRIALTSELARRQDASDIGVGFSALSRWMQRDRSNPEKPTIQTELERELAELCWENRLLREETEVQ